ncbi:methyltransferase-like protein 27 [Babylonia areolata]|uniref:methyltransferase-like protein 27 n=1 Tax=Babylonia areolata TaxID=304850 RepID=UPI003FD1A714
MNGTVDSIMNGVAASVLKVGEGPGARGRLEKEAVEAINFYIKPGIGAERSVKAYDDTSDNYDQYVNAFQYAGPQQVAKTISSLYPEQSQRESVRILDVAAGTGLVGVEMHKEGFRNMDALDPSQGMLNVASRRGIYGRLFTEYIDDKELPIEKDSYDSMVICGGMGENQIPCSALHEMIRLVKPGGYILNMTRAENLAKCSDYVGRLEKLMEQLESDGKWREVARTTFPNFLKGRDGLMLVHQVL